MCIARPAVKTATASASCTTASRRPRGEDCRTCAPAYYNPRTRQEGGRMRNLFDSITGISLWLASQNFFVCLLFILVPYAVITFPVQYWIRRLLKKHEFENNDFAYPMVAGILNGVTGL